MNRWGERLVMLTGLVMEENEMHDRVWSGVVNKVGTGMVVEYSFLDDCDIHIEETADSNNSRIVHVNAVMISLLINFSENAKIPNSGFLREKVAIVHGNELRD